MEDFVRDNAGALITAIGALTVAVIGVWTSEGGRRRRALRQVHEGLQVLALMKSEGSWSPNSSGWRPGCGASSTR